MELTEEIKASIDKSVLCWLATVSTYNVPNVSPKEIFTYYKNNIIMANIASPQSVKNIKANYKVCVSFIDILVQKGYQIKGNAQIITNKNEEYSTMSSILTEMTHGKFPFSSITKIDITSIKPIVAPSYLFYPDTTEDDQIANAKKQYGIQ